VEGYIVTSMTDNKTKILRWRTPYTRLTGTAWSGELDVEEIVAEIINTERMTIDEGTLACGLVHGRILQVTSGGVYLRPDGVVPCTDNERIIHASIWQNNLAMVSHSPNTQQFRLTHVVFLEAESSQITSIPLIAEPSIVKIFPYPFPPPAIF
jgi:Mono-functional DNA-alkylating methyl methanesulfonate N-term